MVCIWLCFIGVPKKFPPIPRSLIFQKSFDVGQLPTDWKLAVVSPIFKKGKKCDAGNYRPVTLTSEHPRTTTLRPVPTPAGRRKRRIWSRGGKDREGRRGKLWEDQKEWREEMDKCCCPNHYPYKPVSLTVAAPGSSIRLCYHALLSPKHIASTATDVDTGSFCVGCWFQAFGSVKLFQGDTFWEQTWQANITTFNEMHWKYVYLKQFYRAECLSLKPFIFCH